MTIRIRTLMLIVAVAALILLLPARRPLRVLSDLLRAFGLPWCDNMMPRWWPWRTIP